MLISLRHLAGADTTVSSGQALILALGMHPEVQRKAQEELDRVVGTDRLPQMSDKANLPYVNAILKEAGRWHTVLPLGMSPCRWSRMARCDAHSA